MVSTLSIVAQTPKYLPPQLETTLVCDTARHCEARWHNKVGRHGKVGQQHDETRQVMALQGGQWPAN